VTAPALCGEDVAELVVVGGGAELLVRPVRRADAPLLAEAFDRLSPQSRLTRFLAPKPSLSAAELRYFSDVDHVDHEALVALSAEDGRVVGVARYVRDRRRRHEADISVEVVDEWHRRGVATALVSRLMNRAWEGGIRLFTALIAVENAAVVALLQGLAAQVTRGRPDRGTVELEIVLTPWTIEDDVLSALHALGPRRAATA